MVFVGEPEREDRRKTARTRFHASDAVKEGRRHCSAGYAGVKLGMPETIPVRPGLQEAFDGTTH